MAKKTENGKAKEFSPLHILFISEYFYPRLAGAEVWAWDLCREVAGQGHKVTVLTLRYDPILPEEETVEGVTIFRPVATTANVNQRLMRMIANKKFARKAKNIILEKKPDIIHTVAYGVNVPISRFAKKNNIPCITSVHAYFGKDWRRLSRIGMLIARMERSNIQGDASGQLIVPSAYLQSRLLAETGKKSIVIHNWLSEKFGKPKSERTALFVGSLEPVKNPLPCIDVASDLGLPLTIIGDGSLRKSIEREAKKKGVECKIFPRLSREETLSLVGGASIVFVPSITESFSLVALEAVAQGTPVAGNMVGILPEIPGVVAFPPKKIPSRLTTAQQAVVRERFSRKRCVEAFIKAYKGVRNA